MNIVPDQTRPRAPTSFWRRFGGFIKYTGAGVVNTCVNYAVYMLALGLHAHYLAAGALGHIAGVTSGYLLNTRYVFRQKKRWQSAARFAVVHTLTLGVNLLLLYLLVSVAGIPKSVAQLLAVPAGGMIGYFLNRHWTFGHGQND